MWLRCSARADRSPSSTSQGREVERYTLPNGARLHVTDGQSVSNGQLLAEWDPFNEPFVSEVDGFIKFTDLVDGKTYQEKLDEATHQASMTIIEYRTTSFRPSVSVCDENGDPKLRGAGQLPRGLQPPRRRDHHGQGRRAGARGRHHRP